ncbi:hypothetical protein LUZ61_002805 [Rhynchospora tenuis]|uniref:SCP domain-containing protein n=1 Tax=Rhynchospora tenuis TaxID=198213 RepID=A0AAD6ES85_9POAL|nr:hypothetical protein LUZ61_002805 [Rhynchospora tenuis]
MAPPRTTTPFTAILAISLFVSLRAVTVAAQYQYWLDPHNVARAALGLKPLKWDAHVASYAQWYANQRRGDCQLRHSNGPYGENLFWGSGVGGWTPAQAVAAWVAEKPQYDYYTNSCNGMCGHYTQIVWRNTRRLGCAMVTCDNDQASSIFVINSASAAFKSKILAFYFCGGRGDNSRTSYAFCFGGKLDLSLIIWVGHVVCLL